MTDHTPPTDQQLTPAEIRLAQYGERTSTWSTATYDSGTEKALHEIAIGLKAEVDRLRAANAQLDRALGETIDDRDQAQEIADKLAYAVAPIEVIGEHSSMNCPWTNALDLITPKAEVDKLRADAAAELLPAWEAMYEPGNVSDYLIGYANDEAAAKGAAEAWMRSQSEVTGRLEWTPQPPLDGYDCEFEMVQRHDDGIDTGPGITVRRRCTAPAAATSSRADVLRDFLWRLEQSAGDAAAEKFLDDNPELRVVHQAPAVVVGGGVSGTTNQ